MEQPKPLSQSEQDLLGQVCNFAVRRASNGVYLNCMQSKSLGQPVLFMIAIGEQALALQQLVLHGAERDTAGSAIEVVSSLDSIEGKQKF